MPRPKRVQDAQIKLNQELIDIFSSCQRTTAVHQRNALYMKQLYEDANHEEFWKCFKNKLAIVLVSENNQLMDKVISFVGLFGSFLKSVAVDNDNPEASVEYMEHQLLTDILGYLLMATEKQEDIVRIRSCQLINSILDNLVGVEVSLELCDKLEEYLVQRLHDPKNIVRQQAVIALYRLQDPSNPNDIIISEFIRLMNSDSYPKVRKLCVERVGVRNDVIGHILVRIRDQDHSVRLAAYKRLSGFAGFLKIHEKQLVLHSASVESSDKIKEYTTSTLVKNWLQHYDNNILKFMKSIRLDCDEKDVRNTVELFEYVLKIIFKNTPIQNLTETLPLNENHLIPTECLNWEMVSYWRIYVQFLSQDLSYEEELEKVVPELIYFCKYIKQFYLDMPKEVTSEEFLEQQFILKQLFLITKTYDFGDVTNRKCLNALVSNILENVVLIADVIETVVSNLENSIPNPVQQTQYISEIISEILCPINDEETVRLSTEREFKISQITVKLNRLKVEQEIALNETKYLECQRLQDEMNELSLMLAKLKTPDPDQNQIQRKTDIFTIIKCLDIAAGILVSPKITQLTSALKALKEDFIQELLIHDNDSIRVKALHCYGLCCIIDKETAETGIHIFSTPIFAYQNGEECDTQTLLECIAAVVDILRIYGPQLMAAPTNEQLSESMEENEEAVFAGGTSLTNVLQGFVDLMDDDQYDIQEQAGCALCQLVLSNRIVSASLLSRLVLKWCNPAAGDNECNRLKQIIGFTLQNVPLIPNCTEQLLESVFITLRALYAAPRISPLAEVSVENIAKFFLALCKVSPKVDYINAKLATTIFTKILENPKSKMNPLFVKMLLLLEIPNSETSIEELLNFCDNVRDQVTEKMVTKGIIKLNSKLSAKALGTEEQNARQEDMTKSTPGTIFEEDEENI